MQTPMPAQSFDRKTGLAFIVAFGIVSLWADMAYEGMRAISGPYLGLLGASGAVVGIVAGGGEMAGYVLRLFTGRLAARTGAYWTITLIGYAVQMAAVPLLAFAGNWQVAAALIVMERAGKAIRNPAAHTMMARAGEKIGQGWAFGLHEGLDQLGAMAGPLITAFVLWRHNDYREAFLWLSLPAALTLLSVTIVCLRFRYAGAIGAHGTAHGGGANYSRAFKLYLAAAALIGFGFADYPLIAFHFAKAGVVSDAAIPVLYAIAMAAAGAGSLIFGRWFDRAGLKVLIPGTLIGAVVAPLAFFGGPVMALFAALLWGTALGIHDAVMSAAVAGLVPEPMRARAYGVFPAVYGISWFLGSALMGWFYDFSLGALVALSVAASLLALVPLALAIRAAKA